MCWGGRFKTSVAALIVLGLGACATAPRPGVNHDRVITQAELSSTPTATMYEAIWSLRPGWLGTEQGSRTTTGTRPSVYMNRLYLGDPAVLAQVRVQDVVEVRLIPPTLARDRYGTTNPAGAIEVVTRDVGAY